MRRLSVLYIGSQWHVKGDGSAGSALVAAGLSYEALRGILEGNDQFTKYELSDEVVAARVWDRVKGKSLETVQQCFNMPRTPET